MCGRGRLFFACLGGQKNWDFCTSFCLRAVRWAIGRKSGDREGGELYRAIYEDV